MAASLSISRLEFPRKDAKAPSQNCIAEELSAFASFAGNRKRLLRGTRRIGNHFFQLDVESAVVGLDASADRNVSRVSGHPDRKLAILLVDEPLWSKQLRIYSKHINASKHRLHPLLLNNLDGNLVNLSAVADEDLETLADFEWLRADEI